MPVEITSPAKTSRSFLTMIGGLIAAIPPMIESMTTWELPFITDEVKAVLVMVSGVCVALSTYFQSLRSEEGVENLKTAVEVGEVEVPATAVVVK